MSYPIHMSDSIPLEQEHNADPAHKFTIHPSVISGKLKTFQPHDYTPCVMPASSQVTLHTLPDHTHTLWTLFVNWHVYLHPLVFAPHCEVFVLLNHVAV